MLSERRYLNSTFPSVPLSPLEKQNNVCRNSNQKLESFKGDFKTPSHMFPMQDPRLVAMSRWAVPKEMKLYLETYLKDLLTI